MTTRKLVLQQAGHGVEMAKTDFELVTACAEQRFDVAVIGQTVPESEKRRILSLFRVSCPEAKVLGLFPSMMQRTLDNADDWLEVPADIPSVLAERISALAARSPN